MWMAFRPAFAHDHSLDVYKTGVYTYMAFIHLYTAQIFCIIEKASGARGLQKSSLL